MDNIRETKELQQKNADAVRRVQIIIRDLISKVNGSGLPPASKVADIKKLNDQLASLKKIEIQMSKPPTNRYEALQVARAQKNEISTIVGEISSINTSIKNKIAAAAQTRAVPQQSHVSPEQSRTASPQTDYRLPDVPTTPIQPRIDRSNLLLDKYIAVEQKLSQTKFQLASLNQRMLAEANTGKKIELRTQIVSAQKIQAAIQSDLNTIRPQLSDPQKSATLDRALSGKLEILNRLDDRMQQAYIKNLPIAPVSKLPVAPQSHDDDERPRGPRR